MDDFEKELKAGFLEEAAQLLNDAEQCFLVLESQPNDVPTLEKIFRIAHNIKGSSKAVGFDSLGAFTHEFESFLLKCKNGNIPVTAATVSLLLKCNDHIKHAIEELNKNFAYQLDSFFLIKEIIEFVPENQKVEEEVQIKEEELRALETAVAESVFECFVEENAVVEAVASENPVVEKTAEDFGSIECVVTESIADVIPIASHELAVPKKVESSPKEPTSSSNSKQVTADESIRVSLGRVESLINYVGELVILQTVLNEQSYGTNVQALRSTVQQLGKVTKEVQELSMGLRMIPLKQTFQKMQRIVRDTSSLLGKKVNLVLEGEDTDVDKTVLEALSDPLVHLIRNAVDHGIESPEERLAKGKSDAGQVKLKAFHQSGKLVIEVTDNGGGISAVRLKQKAIEKGILKPNQEISDKESVNLIFHPGFSTKAQVTEVSGRGVGMDVVKTNIQQLQGEIEVETVVGQGSVFRIVLPLTLAIIDGIVVKCGSERYVIPLSHVHESMKPGVNDIKDTTGLGEVLMLRGENLPVVRLAEALGRKNQQIEKSEQIAVIIRTQSNAFATMVDDVISRQQVVIKKLGNEMKSMKGYSGSAILGDGKPALILELSDLVQNKRQVA